MAIYRIFPEKDTFIYTDQLTGNAGKDEIIEIGGYPSAIDGTGETSRVLLKFADSEIDDVILNEIGNTNFSTSIKLYLAEASELPAEYTIYAYPVYSSTGDWDNGTGKFGDLPVNTTGVSWTYKNANLINPWTTTNFVDYTTGSYTTGNVGGGNWYTASNGEDMEFSQLHN